MGHGNSTKVDPTADYKAALTAEKTKTPGQQLIEDESAKTLGWAAHGDYTNPHAGGVFVNYADPAMLNRNRELTMNAGRQGISALGTPDPNYLATVNENIKAHQAEGDSAQYEHDIQQGVADARAAAAGAEGYDISRKSAALGVTGDLYRQKAAQPAWWRYLVAGAANVGTTVATGGLNKAFGLGG